MTATSDQPNAGAVLVAMAMGFHLGQFNIRSASDAKRWTQTMFPMIDEDKAVEYAEVVSDILDKNPYWMMNKAVM